MKSIEQLTRVFKGGGGGGAAPGIATSPPPAPPALNSLAVTQEQAQTRRQQAQKKGINSSIPGLLGGDAGGFAGADPNANQKPIYGGGGKNSLLGGG